MVKKISGIIGLILLSIVILKYFLLISTILYTLIIINEVNVEITAAYNPMKFIKDK